MGQTSIINSNDNDINNYNNDISSTCYRDLQ